MKINSEMNSKYNTYDHLDKLQCIEDENILNLEKKFDPFSIDKNYNYAINIINVKNSFPKPLWKECKISLMALPLSVSNTKILLFVISKDGKTDVQ